MAEPAYQSLYRRYRPQRFDEVRGQEHVTRALRNAVRDEKVSHAYLFSGPRGTGKTSTARILAKALNCTALVEGEPCGTCESCLAVVQGRSFDVHELDAASNNKVDDIRDLIERAALGSPGRWKVYIVDEVHMLSTAASNALLKTLEEPPGHVVFVLATTDPQKVLPTIRSRTQHYEFRLLAPDVLTGLLKDISADAGLDVAGEAIDLVVRRGRGSARDALSVLDQVAAAGSVEDEPPASDELTEALAERDPGRALVAVARAVGAGRDPRRIAEELIEHLRGVFLVAMGAGSLVGVPDAEVEHLSDQAHRLGKAGITRALDLVGQSIADMKDALDPRISLEVALVRTANALLDPSPAALLERLERLERSLSGHVAEPVRAAARHAADAGAAAVGAAGPAPPAARLDAVPQTDAGLTEPIATAPPREAGAAIEPEPAGSTGEAAVGPPTGPAPAGPPGLAGARAALGAFRGTAGAKPGAGRSTGPSAGTAPSPGPAPRPAPRTAAPLGVSTEAGATRAGSQSPMGTGPEGSPPATGPAGHESGRAASAAPTGPADGAGALPTRDELTKVWGDGLLASLRPGIKARFGAGRFLPTAEGAAVFALPNKAHRDHCETLRPEVEAALVAHFGRPVPLLLVVDDAPTPGDGSPDEGANDGEGNPFDPGELREAAASVTSPEDVLRQAFPGAREVDQ